MTCKKQMMEAHIYQKEELIIRVLNLILCVVQKEPIWFVYFDSYTN